MALVVQHRVEGEALGEENGPERTGVVVRREQRAKQQQGWQLATAGKWDAGGEVELSKHVAWLSQRRISSARRLCLRRLGCCIRLQQNLYPAKPLLTCPYIPHRSHLAWCDAQLVLQLPNSCVADAGDGPVLHLLRLIHLLMS